MNKELRFEKILVRIFEVVAVILFLYLFISSLLVTGVNDWDINNELIYLQCDNILLNLVKIILLIIVFYIFNKLIKKLVTDRLLYYGLGVCLLLVLCISTLLINGANTTPQSDSLFVCNEASKLNASDFSGFNKGGYLSMMPHQLGFISFVRIMFSLFGDPNYRAIQYTNAIANVIIVLSGFMIVKHISKNNKTALWFYLILKLLCVPMYYYSMFVYGETLSTMFVMLSCWMLLRTKDSKDIVSILLYGLFICLSILLRTNCYVLLVANIIVLIIKIIQLKDIKYVFLLISVLAFTILSQFGLNQYYAKYKKEGAGAIPSVAYITMGLNNDKGCPGWHNDYNNLLIKECNYDEELAKSIAIEDLKTGLQYMINNPNYAISFINQKIQCQWNSPMYQAIHMNSYINGEQNSLGYSAYFGTIRHLAEFIMEVYQMALYGSILAYLLINKEYNIENYTLLIGVFGGFLFSIIWEAKTRYIFPYLLMMIPYFSIGLLRLNECILLKHIKAD